MSFVNSLGQGFVDLIGGIKDYISDASLFSWLPTDIQLFIGAVILILIVLGIKRAVAV